MRVNSKGQVTIPAHLRAQLGIVEGDELEVTLVDSSLRIEYEGAGRRGARTVRRMRGTATAASGMSTDQLMGMLRGGGEDADAGADGAR